MRNPTIEIDNTAEETCCCNKKGKCKCETPCEDCKCNKEQAEGCEPVEHTVNECGVPVLEIMTDDNGNQYIRKDMYDTMAEDYHKLQDSYDKCDADRLMALADIANIRRRFEKEKSDLIANGGRNFLNTLLPAFNTIFSAIEALKRLPEENQDLAGLNHIWNELLRVLKNANVEVVVPRQGDDFDVDSMNAIASLELPETDSDYKVGQVALCMSPIYKMNGKVISYAAVGTYKAPEVKEETASEAES